MILVLARTWGVDPGPTAMVAVAVSTGLASISYHLLEMPIRVSRPLGARRARFVVVGAGVAMSLIVGLVVAPELLDGGAAGRTVAVAQPVDGTPVTVDPRAARRDVADHGDCETGGPVLCPLTDGGSRRAVLVGESHAGMLASLFTGLADEHDIELVAGYLPYCPWTRGVRYHGVGKDCFEDQDDLYGRMLPEFDPEIVILAHRAVDDPHDPLEIRTPSGQVSGVEERQAVLDDSITSLVDELRSDGRIVVIVEPVPVSDRENIPTNCLSASSIVEPCRFVTSAEPTDEERIIRRLAESDEGVVALDLDPLVCPYLPICDPVVDGMVVRSDNNHLTVTFADSLRDPVERMLVEREVLRR